MSRGTGAGRHVRYTNGLDLKVNAVCGTCNSGWMSKLEVDFNRVAGDALTGVPIDLDLDGQTIVARWATKTAFMLHMATAHATSGDQIPIAHFRDLYARGLPAPATSVSMAGVDAAGTLVSWIKPTTFSTAGAPIGYQIAFSVGYALFAVVGWDSPANIGAVSYRTNPAMADYFMDVWPAVPGLVHWPPVRTFTQADLDTVWPSPTSGGTASP